MGDTYDFSGWATRNDLKCADGRTIRRNAFKDNDGCRVPLVWNHRHDDSVNVLGHAILENRDEGVYAYCTFNETEAGKNAKMLVQHGDVNALSIYANKLKQSGGDVLHGIIREVSLVLAGANPGAFIDYVDLAHSEDEETDAIIYTDDYIVLYHSDDSKKEKEEEKEEKKEPPAEEKKDDPTIEEVVKTMNDNQKMAMYALIAEASKDSKSDSKEEDSKEDNMKHNVFDNTEDTKANELMHDGLAAIVADAKRCGSLRESYLQHADEYGIKDIEWLFPEAKNINGNGAPGFIKRNPDAWVSVVMNGVHHTPFARVKMMFADLREDDARAKGYAQKGKLKKEEVFGLLKRTVEPTTIYKKQKLDRDDVIDITDFDVISWLKAEMRMMLDEEIARAILFGDGRSAMSDDKISETNIIPIVKDAPLYTITETLASGYTPEDVIDACVKGQNNYEGSGNTILFMANSKVTDLLLIKDLNKHRLYKDVAEVALACTVNRIVKVPDTIVPAGVVGLIVDLDDYNVGADKGGAVNMFDDFDIDYNQMKYLIETRCSGALRKPFSAVVLKEASGAAG